MLLGSIEHSANEDIASIVMMRRRCVKLQLRCCVLIAATAFNNLQGTALRYCHTVVTLPLHYSNTAVANR
jgi:hypothetical protein